MGEDYSTACSNFFVPADIIVCKISHRSHASKQNQDSNFFTSGQGVRTGYDRVGRANTTFVLHLMNPFLFQN